MARDKYYEARMQGMIYAANIAKEKGIDALKREIQIRGVYKVPLQYTLEQLEEFIHEICDNTRNTTFALTFDTLNKEFRFGEQRLQQFADEFNKRFNACLDLDYMGEHFVDMTDFAHEIKSKYKNLTLDIQRIAVCQDEHDKAQPEYRNTRYLDGIINTLRGAGYSDAAEFLEKKKDN